MSTPQFLDSSAHMINGMHEVASHNIGKGIVNVFRNSTTGGKIRMGDYYMGRSRTLVQQYYASLPSDDKEAISARVEITISARQNLESGHGSVFRKFALAREYKRVSKYLFKIVERASLRAADNGLMAQVSEALGGGATQPPPMGTTTTLSNPFSDSHELSLWADVDVENLNEVMMSIFESDTAGEAAVVLELHGRDATIQEVVATFPLEIISGDRTGEEAETATVFSYDTTGREIYGPPSEAGDDADR